MALITCSICDKENVPDWDGKDHCITCARDIALTTPDTAEAKIDEILATFGSELYDYITEKDIIKAAELYAEKPMFAKARQQLKGLLVDAKLDSKLQKAIDMSGNEFAMGYDDSGCFWRFYYGSRGAGSMMKGWPKFESESAEVAEALDEFISALQQTRQEEEQ